MTSLVLDCPVCACALRALPVPTPGRSILSDGRIVARSLEKASCLSCGLACRIEQVDAAAIKSIYSDSYSLSAVSPSADQARAAAYAARLVCIARPPGRVLDIGCGSGNLLKALQALWPAAALFGIDPALPVNVADLPGITYWRDFFDELPHRVDGKLFDVILSINVIEHLSSPQAFFELVDRLLTPCGELVIVCPAAEPANLELLFQDHLNTFTFESLALMAHACGLAAVRRESRLSDLGDFQLAVFSRLATAQRPTLADASALADARRAYLQSWARVDQALLDVIGHAQRVAMFGAGQMAALLRCYAPRAWERVDMLLIDKLEDAWELGKPVATYGTQVDELQGWSVIVATAPVSQAKVASRLAADGLTAVRFDDIVTH